MKLNKLLGFGLALPLLDKAVPIAAKAAKAKDVDWQDIHNPAHRPRFDRCLKEFSFIMPDQLLSQRGKNSRTGRCKTRQEYLSFLETNKAVILKPGDLSEGVVVVIKQMHLSSPDMRDIELNNGERFKNKLPLIPTHTRHQEGIYCFLRDLHGKIGKKLVSVVPELVPDTMGIQISETGRAQYKIENDVSFSDAKIIDTHKDMFGVGEQKSMGENLLYHTSAYVFLATHNKVPVAASYGGACKEMTEYLAGKLNMSGSYSLTRGEANNILKTINMDSSASHDPNFFQNNINEISSRATKHSYNCRDQTIISSLVQKLEQSTDQTCSVIPNTAVYTVGMNHDISEVINMDDGIKNFKGVIYEILVPTATSQAVVEEHAVANRKATGQTQV